MSESSESSEEFVLLPAGPIIVAMKGHRCSGKTTLARDLAMSLRLQLFECSLLTYDDLRASIREIIGSSKEDRERHDNLAYRIMWQIASTDLSLAMSLPRKPRALVLDSSLPLSHHLEQVLNLRGILRSEVCGEPLFVVIECRPRDEAMWRQRSESHAAVAHEPLPWEGIQREISEHKEYSMDGVMCLTVDTTDPIKSPRDHATDVITQILSCYQNLRKKPFPNSPIKDVGLSKLRTEACWRNPDHAYSLSFFPNDDIVEPNNNEASTICTLCKGTLSGPVYHCSDCGFYLHKSCSELPRTIKFCRLSFALDPKSDEIDQPSECVVCYRSMGVLYRLCGEYKWHIHSKCAQLPHDVKHSCHEHRLELRFNRHIFICAACGTSGHVAGYFCCECLIHFHIACTLYLEASIVHKCHWHRLLLCTLPRDETDEYFCEVCAMKRHPDLWIYYCKPCEYEAHISCVNPSMKPCDPQVFLPEYRAEDGLSSISPQPKYLPGWRNPVLPEISGSQLAWKLVDSEDESESHLE